MILGSLVVCFVYEAAAVAVDVAVAVAAVAAVVACSLVSLRFAAKKLARVCLLNTCADTLHVVSDGDAKMVRN